MRAHDGLYMLLVELQIALLLHPMSSPDDTLRCALTQMLLQQRYTHLLSTFKAIMGAKHQWRVVSPALKEAGLL